MTLPLLRFDGLRGCIKEELLRNSVFGPLFKYMVRMELQLRDGRLSILMIRSIMIRKNAQEPNVMDTEVSKTRQNQERHARNGTPKLHTSITTLQKRNQTRVSDLIATAEILMEKSQSGAIPLIQSQDGSIVNHLSKRRKTSTSVSDLMKYST
jgi:hypothetical protein